MLNPENRNTGVIIMPPSPTDFIAGQESGVAFEANVEDGQHDAYLPNPEYQWGPLFDTSGCTDFTCNNSQEMQARMHLKKNHLSAAQIKKLTDAGYIKNETMVDLSDWFNYLVANTDPKRGNFLVAPWDATRKFGALPEADMSYQAKRLDPKFTLDQFVDRKQLTSERMAKALIWNEVFETTYEWVPVTIENLMYHLKQAPLCLITACCSPWGAGIIPRCDRDPAHANTLYGFNQNTSWKDFDTYNPVTKTFAWDYKIFFALKGVLTPRKESVPGLPSLKHVFSTDLFMGETSDDVRALQMALKIDGEFKLQPTGYYGTYTKDAVKAFQIKYQVAPAQEIAVLDGKRVGIKTRTQLNLLFNK